MIEKGKKSPKKSKTKYKKCMYGFKTHSKIWFSVNPPIEGSVNSREEITDWLAQRYEYSTLVGKGGCSKTETMPQLLSWVTFNIKNFFPLSSISYSTLSVVVPLS
jgi:hypothetical protein